MYWCATIRHRWRSSSCGNTNGAGNGWIVDRVIKDIEDFGCARTATWIKCDQEPTILEVQRGIAQKRKAHAGLANSPVCDSQSNGTAENAIRRFR